jgi:hypothetical protein
VRGHISIGGRNRAPALRSDDMHATLAYLNAAGQRAARLSPSKCVFLQVMDTLLANPHGAPRRKAKRLRAIRKVGKAG